MKVLTVFFMLMISVSTLANDCVAYYKLEYGMSDNKALIACSFGEYGKAMVDDGFSVTYIMRELHSYSAAELHCLDSAVRSGQDTMSAVGSCYNCEAKLKRAMDSRQRIINSKNITEEQRAHSLRMNDADQETIRLSCED